MEVGKNKKKRFTQDPPEPSVDCTAWDFGGVRRWQWMHDGYEVNGWIEFLSGGILRTSFEKKTVRRTYGVTRRTATSSRRSTVATIICSWLTMASLSFVSSIAFFLMDFLLVGSATHVGFWLRLRRTHRLMRLRVRCEYDT